MSTPIRRSGYLPTLDGWRAIAILAVICNHDAVHSFWFLSTRWLNSYGYVGVEVFFAISGLLICSRLLDEEQRDGSISLRRFYVRRGFRILPPAIFFLLTIAVLSKVGILNISAAEWFKSLFFFRNYPTVLTGGAMGYYTAHFWSLSLEEQFYFVFPLLLVFSPKRYRVAFLALISVLISIHRTMVLQTRPWIQISLHADTRLDALFVAALFAVLASDSHMRAMCQRALRFWPALVLLLLVIIPLGGEGSAWQITAKTYLMPCIILGSVLNSDNLFGRALEWKPLRFVGRISYSLYLWQQLFFSEHFGGAHPFGILQTWPLRLIVSFACALASYYLLELPLVRLGHRWAPSATPGRPELRDIAVAHPEYRPAPDSSGP